MKARLHPKYRTMRAIESNSTLNSLQFCALSKKCVIIKGNNYSLPSFSFSLCTNEMQKFSISIDHVIDFAISFIFDVRIMYFYSKSTSRQILSNNFSKMQNALAAS